MASEEGLEDWTSQHPGEQEVEITPMERLPPKNIPSSNSNTNKNKNKNNNNDDDDNDTDKKKEPPKQRQPVNDFGEDEDTENAIRRSSVRVGLPMQCVGM